MKKIILTIIGLFFCVMSFAQKNICGDWVGHWNYRDPTNSNKWCNGRTIVRVCQNQKEEYEIRIKEEFGDSFSETYYWPTLPPASITSEGYICIPNYNSYVLVNDGDNASFGSLYSEYTLEFELQGSALVMRRYMDTWKCSDKKGQNKICQIRTHQPLSCIEKWQGFVSNNASFVNYHLIKDDYSW